MEQKYAAWAEQLRVAGTSMVPVWAVLVLGCRGAQASSRARLGAKHLTSTYQL